MRGQSEADLIDRRKETYQFEKDFVGEGLEYVLVASNVVPSRGGGAHEDD